MGALGFALGGAASGFAIWLVVSLLEGTRAARDPWLTEELRACLWFLIAAGAVLGFCCGLEAST